MEFQDVRSPGRELVRRIVDVLREVGPTRTIAAADKIADLVRAQLKTQAAVPVIPHASDVRATLERRRDWLAEDLVAQARSPARVRDRVAQELKAMEHAIAALDYVMSIR